MSAIFRFFFGDKDKTKQLPTISPEQQQALSQVLGQLGGLGGPGGGYGQSLGYLQNLLSGSPEAIAGFEAPYLQRFQQEIIPGIAERFAGLDPMGSGLSSSGFGQALSSAGSQLQSQLAALRSGLQQQAAQGLMGQYNQLLGQGLGTRAFENVYQPGSTGFLGQLGAGLAGGIGAGLGMGSGIGLGGALGGALGGLFGQRNNTNMASGPFGGGNYYNPYSGYQDNQFFG